MEGTMFWSWKVFIAVLSLNLIILISGHGRLTNPPSRHSMWRYGFNNPPDYDDTAGYCGGFDHYKAQGMRCGICGDPYDQPKPRAHENGGQYGRGTIVKKYNKGQTIDVSVQITANHMGYMEFRVCPTPSQGEVSESCLKKNTLKLANGKGTRYVLPTHKPDTYVVKLKLPKNLKCKQCTFQWQYTAGNNWGYCPDGKGKLGCGPQEVFRACADISIS